MLDRFPDRGSWAARAAAHSVVSHQPCPNRGSTGRGQPTDYELPTDRINLAYFGVFYATRGLTEVWQALRRLPRRARDFRSCFTCSPVSPMS